MKFDPWATLWEIRAKTLAAMLAAAGGDMGRIVILDAVRAQRRRAAADLNRRGGGAA
ncbi:hypothetical protein MR829_11320 [Paracoccus versutus]|uniref:hypothetical protein n=1 Tax=Paracoccus versutus TaxID=34007 RepID=UPI001FB80635|nr:hypothetical protein [Paracoccus versutus]MCJ1900963.1 hypothetical protein [Paracoccus versutus]